MIDYKPLIVSRTLPHLGGRERIVQSMINYFRGKGVTVVTPDEFESTHGINIITYKEDERLWSDLMVQLDQYDFNVIHCHTFYLADFAIKVSEFFKIPLIFTLHGVFFNFYGDKYDSIIKRIADNCTIFTTVSDRYRTMLQKFLGDGKNVEFISNGIIPQPYNEKDYKKFNTEEVTVAVPARLAKIKGLEYLIESLPLLKKNIKIHICSPAGRKVNEEMRFKTKLLDRIVTSNIFFHEYDNDQWMSFLKKVDIVLLPSLIEGQSLALLESMSQKKIVIATNVGGNSEIVSHGFNGLIIESKSSRAISESLDYIMTFDNKSRDRMRNNARLTVIEKFTFEKMIQSYISMYEKAILLKQKKPKDVQAVIIKNSQNPEFLVLKRLNKNSGNYEFRLVKGGIKKDENIESALIREITEETGIQGVDILTKLEPYSYSYFLKRVYITHDVATYLVKSFSDEKQDLINQAEEGGFNIDSISWVNEENIIKTLTYPQEQGLARQALQYLKK